MAKQTNTYQPKGFNNALQTFVNSDGTSGKDIISAGSDDSVITSLIATSDDAAAGVLNLILSNGSSEVVIGAYSIPALAGTIAATSAVDLLAKGWLPLLAGKRVITLKTGWKLRAAMQAAVTSGATVALSATAQDY